MKRPDLPEMCTLEQVIQWVMYSQCVSRRKAKLIIRAAFSDGSLPFYADLVDADGKLMRKTAKLRVLNGRIVEEH